MRAPDLGIDMAQYLTDQLTNIQESRTDEYGPKRSSKSKSTIADLDPEKYNLENVAKLAKKAKLALKTSRPKIDISNMGDEEIDNYFNSL